MWVACPEGASGTVGSKSTYRGVTPSRLPGDRREVSSAEISIRSLERRNHEEIEAFHTRQIIVSAPLYPMESESVGSTCCSTHQSRCRADLGAHSHYGSAQCQERGGNTRWSLFLGMGNPLSLVCTTDLSPTPSQKNHKAQAITSRPSRVRGLARGELGLAAPITRERLRAWARGHTRR